MKKAYTVFLDLEKMRKDLEVDYSLINDRDFLYVLILVGRQTLVLIRDQQMSSEFFYKMLKRYVSFVLKKHL